jgi:hypothetical protein
VNQWKSKEKEAMTTTSTIAWDYIRDEILADPEVKAEYDALQTEFNIARHIIALRKDSERVMPKGLCRAGRHQITPIGSH